MEKLIKKYIAVSSIHRNEMSSDEIQESVMTMAQQFWETFYNLTFNTKPMYALFDAMKHLYEMNCSEEAFGIFHATYILTDERIRSVENLGTEKDSQELFMNEFLAISENVIEEIDRDYRSSFAAYIHGKENLNDRM